MCNDCDRCNPKVSLELRTSQLELLCKALRNYRESDDSNELERLEIEELLCLLSM